MSRGTGPAPALERCEDEFTEHDIVGLKIAPHPRRKYVQAR
jgi:hypothetical protein